MTFSVLIMTYECIFKRIFNQTTLQTHFDEMANFSQQMFWPAMQREGMGTIIELSILEL